MAKVKLTPQFLQEVRELATRWGKIAGERAAREAGSDPSMDFADMEQFAAVAAAGRRDRYWPFEVAGGTHVDPFAAFGWGLQAQLPFARRAFDLLVDIVERDVRPGGAGVVRRVTSPDEM